MEAMHKDSCACAKSELDLFSVPPTQVEMEKGFWEDIDPITSIAASDTIKFLCAANSGVYTDLASSYLHVKAKITAADGANLDADVQVGPVNLWLHALFSQVEVFLNNKLVTPSSTAYPYRAYIETILNFSKDAKDSHLTSALFYKDKAGKMDSVNPLAEAANVNTGLKERHAHTRQSRSVAMEGRIHSDLFAQEYNDLDFNLLDFKERQIQSHGTSNSNYLTQLAKVENQCKEIFKQCSQVLVTVDKVETNS